MRCAVMRWVKLGIVVLYGVVLRCAMGHRVGVTCVVLGSGVVLEIVMLRWPRRVVLSCSVALGCKVLVIVLRCAVALRCRVAMLCYVVLSCRVALCVVLRCRVVLGWVGVELCYVVCRRSVT